MPFEIERKYLIKKGEGLPPADIVKILRIKQAYLKGSSKDCTTRIRLQDEEAFITIKGETVGIQRSEYEYNVPYSDGLELFKNKSMTQHQIEKYRVIVEHEGFTWEVDIFKGDLEGLVVAEVELEDANEDPILPDWVGEEVSDDHRYLNAVLAKEGIPS